MGFHEVPPPIAALLRDKDFVAAHRQHTTMAQFLGEYIVHDSPLCRLEMRGRGRWELVVYWDMYVPRDNPFRKFGYTYLTIDFTFVAQIIGTELMTSSDNYISGGRTRRVTTPERQQWADFITTSPLFPAKAGAGLTNKTLHRTSFYGHSSDSLSLLHLEPTYILVTDRYGNPLVLPGLTLDDVT